MILDYHHSCRPKGRTEEDIAVIYDELLQVKAFAHLSNAVSIYIVLCTVTCTCICTRSSCVL